MSLIDQALQVERDGTVKLHNKVSTDFAEKLNYEARMADPKGKSEGGTMRRIASIPEFEFQADPLLREYVVQLQNGDQDGARKTMRFFLELHPEYRNSEGKL